MKITRFALFSLLLLLCNGFAHAGQILVNGDLETGSISPWTTDTRDGPGLWTITSTGCFAGTYCATDTGNAALEQTFAAVSTSTITSLTYEVKSAVSLNAYDLFYSGGGDDEFVASLSSGAWTLVDATANLRSNAMLIGFEVFGYSGGSNGPTLLDNLSLQATPQSVPPSPAPEPSSLILLGTGVLGIAGSLRRRLLA